MSEHVFENNMTYSEKQNKPKSRFSEIYNPMIGSELPILEPPTILPKIINSPIVSTSHKSLITGHITINK